MITRKAKLDLHGVRHRDVRDKVIRIVEDNWDADVELELITGHSNEMKAIVTDVLNEYELPYNEGTFFNKGVILTYL